MIDLTSIHRVRAALVAGFALVACARSELPVAQANDNRTAAGVQHGDTVRLELEAKMARYYPESDSGPFLTSAVFSEVGEAPQVPAPLIRVRSGTTLHATVRNALADTILVVGLHGAEMGGRDTLRLAPGSADSLSALVRTPGTFAYYAHSVKNGKITRHGPGEQLFGAFVVDTTNTANDRVFVIKAWNDADSIRFVLMFNGKSWPYTERLTLDNGDTLRVRLINGADSDHPMHLHGFYYNVDARGRWHSDTVLSPSDRKLVVTETLRPTQTMALTWVPTRPGNWLLHCHDAFHINGSQHDYLAGRVAVTPSSTHDAVEHLRTDMAGLVLGISVRGEQTRSALASTDRRFRLFVRERARGTLDSLAAYAYAGSDSSPFVWPPPTLTLTRGQRTAITVVNRLSVPTGVHWHGIELESYYDGVAGWSGNGPRLAPLIAPNDSFVAIMTPPRAGTFIYHAHVDDELQIGLGLAAPLLVLEPGARRDTTRDHVWLFTVAGISDSIPVVLNGARLLAPITAGVPHRLRIISISPGDIIDLELRDSTGAVRWRPVAKDGADLPANQATERTARATLASGETADFIWVPRRGRYILKVDTFNKFEVPIEARD